ncbi:hypothetical protein DID73_02295 [Candidatus Marinamargulisbacteria bacterium SCGC AG-343-K17]|nr:hypothetical protein DID73_02295 [Candidatus Marinamargulisbacteria bacterium SCGC AG-343-K17]
MGVSNAGGDFGDILNNKINDLNPVSGMESQSSAQAEKLDALKQFQKLQTKQVQNGSLTVPDAKELTQIISSNRLPDFNSTMVSMILNLQNSVLDAVMIDLLSILSTELGGDSGIDISFLINMVSKMEVVARDSINPEYSKSLQSILSSNINNITNDSLKTKIQEILQGINQLDMTQSLEVENAPKQKVDPSSVPKSSNVDVLGASNAVNLSGLDGIDDMVFDKNSVTNKNKSIEIKTGPQGGVVADIALQSDEKVVGHAKAFGTLNNMDVTKEMNPFISAIIQIANVQPLFVISSVVSQMLVQMGRLVEDTNLFKVAIVTDNVAALMEIDRMDYIRKVQISDDSHYAIYEEYKRLYEEGYHFIISLHLNHNLKKTYKSALAAKKHIDEQKIKDLEIHVYNTNANGVGLGLMIYELVDAIKNNYSPLEVNKLAQQLVKNYRHWVCPLEFDFVKNHQWVMDLADNQKKVQMRLFHFVPVIELDKKLTIITVSYTKESAFATLIAAVDDAISTEKRRVNRICVEYRGVYREAIKIRNQIKVKYPSMKVSLQSVGSLTTQFFGPELVGICII